jgi:hypothetical protein
MSKIVLSKNGKESIDELCNASLRVLYENYIEPLKQGRGIEGLRGKYKPSWELPKTYSGNSIMKVALADFAKKYNLYHYHFGFKHYKSGNDPKYPGDESAGILHTSNYIEGEESTHVIFRVDREHPSPFTVPMRLELE